MRKISLTKKRKLFILKWLLENINGIKNNGGLCVILIDIEHPDFRKGGFDVGSFYYTADKYLASILPNKNPMTGYCWKSYRIKPRKEWLEIQINSLEK